MQAGVTGGEGDKLKRSGPKGAIKTWNIGYGNLITYHGPEVTARNAPRCYRALRQSSEVSTLICRIFRGG